MLVNIRMILRSCSSLDFVSRRAYFEDGGYIVFCVAT